MDNKVLISSLASSLAQSSGKTKKLCEDFLREFFRVASECLETGESLKIKGFGTFKLVEVESRSGVNVSTGERQEIAGYKKVVFTPAKELATEINAPFQDFESVEIDDELPEDIEPEDTEEEASVEEIVEEPHDSQPESQPESAEQQNPESDSKPGSQEQDYPATENDVETGIIEAGSDEEAEDDEITYQAYQETEEEKVELPVYEDEEESPKNRFGIGFLLGALSMFAVCAVIFMLGCFFDWWPVNFGNPRPVADIEKVVAQDEAAEEASLEEETREEVPPVYDTVSTTRFLTTIAREHYGDFNFWPYIYLENESILGHPDRITPGTKVVVPELSKYGVDPKNPADVAAAKKKSMEIYSRFK